MLNRLQDVFASFQKNRVRYVLIGGIAAVLHGVPVTLRETTAFVIGRLFLKSASIFGSLPNQMERLCIMPSWTVVLSHNAGEIEMVFQYFSDTDMLYIRLAERASSESEEVAPGIVIDFDEHNQVVGIEIENASTFIDLSRLEVLALPIANLTLREKVSEEV